MPDTRGQPLPSEILAVLKSSAVTSWLRSFLIATTSAESIGRYPGNGSAQVDSYVYPDAADANFPYNFDYVIPSNFQRFISGKLSFKIRAFRSYNTFSATMTGGQSNTHVHAVGGESGHTHAHSHHNTPTTVGYTASFNLSSSAALEVASGPSPGWNTDSTSTASSGHNHGNSGGASADHTHTISVTSTLGIFEDTAPVNPGITVAVDGVDVTAKIGGPFNSDQVEIDMSQLIATTPKIWHTVSLQPNQRVRLTGILRLAYYTDSRLTQ